MIPKHPQFCIPKDPPKNEQDSKILSPMSTKKPPRSIHRPSQENKISKRQAKKQRKKLREQKMLEELSKFANTP